MIETNLSPIAAGAKVVIAGTAQLEESEAPVNLTGKTLTFTVKRKSTDADTDALISKTSPASGIAIVSAAAGTFTVTLNPADTRPFNQFTVANYYYDIMLKDNADATNVYRLVKGILTISGSVTHNP